MQQVTTILKKLTLEEKARLCGGGGFWDTAALPGHGIPAINLTDGPHGVRKQEGAADHLGMNGSVQTTCFPTAAGLACSWDKALITEVAAAIGEEAQACDVQVVLGPGANIKRSPLCGRNFEYYSEDPYLTGQLAAAHIRGLQRQGVGASLKHFAVNNQETRRFNINAIVDQRALREIYLAGFETAVKEARPWTVMAAYNQINGEYCSQNKKLLTDILRDQWGFEGLVVSDWFAVCERELGLAAGLDLEMPTSAGVGAAAIVEAVNNGSLSAETLDAAVERILKVVLRAAAGKKPGAAFDKTAHHALARQAARESVVLLKNQGGILPLANSGRVALMGKFAQEPRYQGMGSSYIHATQVDIPVEEIKKIAPRAEVTYSETLEDAREAAKAADVCILFAGLSDKEDTEGMDRQHLRLPDAQNQLIEEVAALNPNLVVVLMNGSAVEMPWLTKARGVLEAYLGGQAMAGAVAEILFGEACPCGKLAETFPLRLQDTPCYLNFPGGQEAVEYREGLFVGYRYYDKADVAPLFPFGFGLSYTAFAYSGLALDKVEMTDADTLTVKVAVKNTGSRGGSEIVQLYVRDTHSTVIRPDKELKGFEKIALEPGEEQTVAFTLNKRAFAFYDPGMADWRVESGDFEILIGTSSADILLAATVRVNATTPVKKNFSLDSTLFDIKDQPAAAPLLQMMREGMAGGAALGMDADAVLASMKIRSLVPISAMRGGTGLTIEKLRGLVAMLNA
jgi:beta-glucosidase